MRIFTAFACTALALHSARVCAQGSVSATVHDSLSALSPAQRYAQICPGPRESDTGAIIGRVRDADDSTALASATVNTQWIDVKLTGGRSAGHLSSASTRTNGSGFYLLCGVPTQVRLNLRSEHGGYVGSPAQLALDDRLIGSVDFALRRIDRIAGDTSLASSGRAQQLAPVAIDEKAVLPSWMERSGFETRRHQGLGAFLTAQEIGRHGYSDLASILRSVRGINVVYISNGGRTIPFPYLLGISDFNGARCVPNVFLDGAPFPIAANQGNRTSADNAQFEVLSSFAHPEAIKGIEVYSNPGTIPAQYDMTSTTGCGSIVIWTR
jgi:hypothetical protein